MTDTGKNPKSGAVTVTEHPVSICVQDACEYIQQRLAHVLKSPPIGIICGSGLGGLSGVVMPEPRCDINYSDIPHFPRSTGKSVI